MWFIGIRAKKVLMLLCDGKQDSFLALKLAVFKTLEWKDRKAISQEASDLISPYVTLVVKGGKEFKAQRHILSDASPFFEKLLNSDMKVSCEGVLTVVWLEMLTEVGMSDILDFIYTATVFRYWMQTMPKS